MVRADTNDNSDGKKEATAKKQGSPSKKNSSPRTWSCKINGCNKQFAREADLKRHQRTTKLHSMPGFSCPQCDATFTRTDALRRHQKSRHKGIIIEPAADSEKAENGENTRMSESPSSRDGTPSSKDKDDHGIASVQTNQGSSTNSGPSNYYRPHTMTVNPYLLPRSTYPPVPLPEGATRLHPTHTWAYSWPGGPTGTLVPAFPISGQPGAYYPSSHYRQPNSTGKNGSQSAGSVSPLSTSSQSSFSIASDDGHRPVTASSSKEGEEAVVAATEEKDDSVLNSQTRLTEEDLEKALQTIIDSANAKAEASTRESPSPSSLSISGVKMKPRSRAEEGTVNPVSLHTKASVEAGIREPSIEPIDIFNNSPLHPHSPNLHSDTPTSLHMRSPLLSHSALNGVDDGPLSDSLEPSMDDPYASKPLQRPEPMEHLLTEDGEPMLNPAELLTQESLASPPPS